jgi:curved DNA-binding protein CbpA
MPSDRPLQDHFAALGEPRRPWLDAAALKEKFRQVVAATHPDVGGSPEAFSAANAAYSVLSNPTARLRHLLELEAPEALAGAGTSIPPELAERFMEAATLRREVDAFLRQQTAATTPLAQALLASERFMQRRDVESAHAELEAMHAQRLEAVRAEDARWEARDFATAVRLAALQQGLSYLDRWSAQLRELLVQLGA